jgi:hypothetical protein
MLIVSMLRWWNTVAGPVYGLDNWGMISLWGAAVGLVGVLSTGTRYTGSCRLSVELLRSVWSSG